MSTELSKLINHEKKINRLRNAEHDDCMHLLLKDNEDELVTDSLILSMKDITKKRIRKRITKRSYMSCNVILGSVAEIKRLQSIAGNLLSTDRRRVTPQMFEALALSKNIVHNRISIL